MCIFAYSIVAYETEIKGIGSNQSWCVVTPCYKLWL